MKGISSDDYLEFSHFGHCIGSYKPSARVSTLPTYFIVIGPLDMSPHLHPARAAMSSSSMNMYKSMLGLMPILVKYSVGLWESRLMYER